MDDSNTTPLPRLGSIVLAVTMHMVALVALLMVLIFVVPQLQQLYEDLDLPLSHSVIGLVALSKYAVWYWYAIVGVVLVADIVIVCLLGWNRFLADNVLPLANYAVLLGTLLVVALMMCTLMTPLQ